MKKREDGEVMKLRIKSRLTNLDLSMLYASYYDSFVILTCYMLLVNQVCHVLLQVYQ